MPSGFNQGNSLTLNLNRSDFTTAKRIVDKINDMLGHGVAQAIDGGSIRVTAPLDPSQRVDYLSILETLKWIRVRQWRKSSSTRVPAPSSSART